MSDSIPPSLRSSLPSGTVTFLLTDIVGSTALGSRLGEGVFSDLIQRHHALLRQVFLRTGGREFKEAGDGFWVAFPDARTALCCARECHHALLALGSPQSDTPLRIRTALFVAEAVPHENDYHGLALHHASRLLGAAQGGQILLSESVESLLRHRMPDGMTLRDRGVYRLRDSPAPQRLFDVVWPDMPVPDPPAPHAPPIHSPVLPPVFTRFIGRESEIAEIASLLRERQTPLLTLTGIGGAGKSRLAREVAHRVAAEFDGAVWFVSLADLSDATRLAESIAEAVSASPGGDPWAALTAVLAPQPCLLILDNLEQLIAGDGRISGADDFLHRLGEQFPSVVCLATSRQRLGLSSEREYPVCPLPIPPSSLSAMPLERLGVIGSVALFVDRACRVRSDFRLTAHNAAAVSELCRRLDGIPLALELAAAWARLLTPLEMLAEFRTIRQSRDKDLPARHRSLTAAVAGSYRLLDPDLRRFFRRLAVFRSGWTVAAARVVCEAPDALIRLGELQDRSLLVVEERGDGSRYQFLETLREFAEERLVGEDPAEAADTAARHSVFFAQLAADAEPALKGADQAAWLKVLADEHPNLQAALSHAAPEARLQMATNLHRYWMVRGHSVEGRKWITETLSANPGLDSDTMGISITLPTRISAFNIAGALALSAGDFAAAQPLFTECLTLSRESGDEVSDALSRVNLAIIASQREDFETARREYEESLPIWRRLNRTATLAIVLSNLGGVALDQKDFDSARSYLEESLSLQLQDQDSLLRANTLHNLAEIAFEQSDLPKVSQYLNTCLSVRLALEDRSAILNLIDLAARLTRANGFLELGAELYGVSAAATKIAETRLSPTTQSRTDARIVSLRVELGEEMFSKAWDRGCLRTWAEMVELLCRAVRDSPFP